MQQQPSSLTGKARLRYLAQRFMMVQTNAGSRMLTQLFGERSSAVVEAFRAVLCCAYGEGEATLILDKVSQLCIHTYILFNQEILAVQDARRCHAVALACASYVGQVWDHVEPWSKLHDCVRLFKQECHALFSDDVWSPKHHADMNEVMAYITAESFITAICPEQLPIIRWSVERVQSHLARTLPDASPHSIQRGTHSDMDPCFSVSEDSDGLS